MAYRKANGVQQTATGTGTGALTLGGVTSAAYETLVGAGFVDGDVTHARIQHATIPAEWEITRITFVADTGTISRTFDGRSRSPTGGRIAFSTGTKIVTVAVLASDGATIDDVEFQVRLGVDAIPATTAGQAANSIAIGFNSQFANRTNDASLSIGNFSMADVVDGRASVALGHGTMRHWTATTSNTVVGAFAAEGSESNPPSGTNNTIMGEAAALWIAGSASSFNSIYGYNAGFGLSTGDRNALFGFGAGNLILDATGTTALGTNAYQYGRGDENVFIGYLAGRGKVLTPSTTATVANGATRIHLDSIAGLSTGDTIYIGAAVVPGTTITAVGTDYVDISAATFNVTTLTVPWPVVIVPDIHTGTNNVIIGYTAGLEVQGALDYTVGIGGGALRFLTTGTGNTAVGGLANNSLVTGINNSSFGFEAGRINLGDNNSSFGWKAGRGNSALDGDDNSAFGATALTFMQTGAERNSAFGSGAGSGLSTGTDNAFFGYNAGSTTTTGSKNVMVGSGVVASGATASNELNIANIIYGTGAIDGATKRAGILTAAPTEALDVNGDGIRVRTARTPASASATGNAGTIVWDTSYVYVCTATDTWKRAALATW